MSKTIKIEDMLRANLKAIDREGSEIHIKGFAHSFTVPSHWLISGDDDPRVVIEELVLICRLSELSKEDYSAAMPADFLPSHNEVVRLDADMQKFLGNENLKTLKELM